ncbi:MAG: hypothetical protein ACAF41_33790 (plasmid) [Leptolyngbya sp. BL-A-14]
MAGVLLWAFVGLERRAAGTCYRLHQRCLHGRQASTWSDSVGVQGHVFWVCLNRNGATTV